MKAYGKDTLQSCHPQCDPTWKKGYRTRSGNKNLMRTYKKKARAEGKRRLKEQGDELQQGADSQKGP